MGDFVFELIISAGLAYHVMTVMSHKRQVDKLLNRLMARNYQEFEYYEKKFDDDRDELKRRRDIERKAANQVLRKKAVPDEREAERVLSQLEDDWDVDEVDTEKLLEREG